jgi:hypothetical protein
VNVFVRVVFEDGLASCLFAFPYIPGSGAMAGAFSALRSFSAGFLMSLPVIVAVSDNIVGISRVHGDSMLPCLQHGDFILVAKYISHHLHTYTFHHLQRHASSHPATAGTPSSLSTSSTPAVCTCSSLPVSPTSFSSSAF